MMQFNLLPWREVRRQKRGKKTGYILIGAVLMVFLVGAGYYLYLRARLDDLKAALTIIEAENQMEKKVSEAHVQMRIRRDALQQQHSAMYRLGTVGVLPWNY